MSQNITLITGATGKTGRRVAALLREQGRSIREASRSSSTVFDWQDRDTWDAALEDVASIFLVPPYDSGPDVLRRFADRAVTAGAVRAVLISTPALGDGADPRQTENQITDAGLELTALRPRWFNQNFSEDFLLPFVLDGALRLPAGHGREAFVDADDIAEVAVAALTEWGHAGRVYDLTGPRLLTFADIAAELSSATGRHIAYTPITSDDFVAEQIATGVPAEWAHLSAELYSNIAIGAMETLSTDIETVLRRPATDFTSFARNAATIGIWTGGVRSD